jgi:rare lipoprotein A
MMLKKLLTLIFIIFIFLSISKKDVVGIASWYSVKSSSEWTASGERFSDDALTCAVMDYPFGTMLKVTNINNSKFVLVRVNDTGNFKKYGRIIDLSKGAFAKIANLKQGVITVKIEVVSP